MGRHRYTVVLAAVAYLGLWSTIVLSDIVTRQSETLWIAVLAAATVALGFAVGRLSATAVAVPLALILSATATWGPCDPEVAYSCDPSVDPWWPAVATVVLPVTVLLALGAGARMAIRRR